MFLDLNIYYNFFHISNTEISKELYESIKNYDIYFIHQNINNELSNKNIYLEDSLNTIIIDINNNYYESSKEKNLIKYNLVNQFINLNIVYYLDTLINSKKIYIIDSFISLIVYPLYINDKLKYNNITIFDKNTNQISLYLN